MRYPSVAGRFYPSNRPELKDLVEYCFEHPIGPGKVPDTGSERSIRSIIVPHAGIAVSGPVAAHGYSELKKDGHRDAYIIIGPDHYGQPFDVVTCSEPYVTPLGECKVSPLVGKFASYIPDSPNAHRYEHSIEVELPFLQYIDPDAEIVPIIMGRQDISTARKLADIIRTVTEGKDVCVIASSDLMHYVPDSVEKELDSMFIDKVLDRDIEGMYDTVMSKSMSVCGYGPMATAILASEPKKSKLLCHSNSWETIHYDKGSVVGYMSAIFR